MISIQDRDKQYIWHPLNQHKTHPNSKAITHAKGIYLFDEEGNTYIDGISSWYTAVYGHCNPFILDAVKKQLDQLNQIVFSGFTHEPAVVLSEKLMEILPNNQAKIFFSDNGSTAVEVGLKMGVQFFSNQGIKKNKIIALTNSFHGDTFGAMAASEDSVYNKPFQDFLLDIYRIHPPTKENLSEVKDALLHLISKGDVATFIYEPLVQGAAGMQMYDADALNEILRICKQHQVLLIADEVMTGFGKTGKYFASDWMETKPDIMCLSKALSAGVVPLAITACTKEIYDAFYSEDNVKGLFHAHTYSANAVACSAAIAGLELLQTKEIQENIQYINQANKLFLEDLQKTNKIVNARQIGVIAAFELQVETKEVYGVIRDQLFQCFMDKGLCLRPLGNTIYIVPPYVISKEELALIHQIIKEVVVNFEETKK